MNFRKWRLGLLIAIACGLLSAGAGLAGEMNLKAFIAVLCTAILTNMLNYLKQHPIENIQDTVFLNKDTTTKQP